MTQRQVAGYRAQGVRHPLRVGWQAIYRGGVQADDGSRDVVLAAE